MTVLTVVILFHCFVVTNIYSQREYKFISLERRFAG